MSACTSRNEAIDPVSSSADEVAKATVLDAYNAYWTTFMAASNPPDSQSAELSKVAVPPELDSARSAIAARAAAGEGFAGSYAHDDSATLNSPTSAVVLDCLKVDADVIDLPTGQIKSTAPSLPVPVSVEMTLDNGVWKVARISTGTQTCAQALLAPPGGSPPAGPNAAVTTLPTATS